MIYINEKFVDSSTPSVCASDRGLLLGDGLFETIRAYAGKTPYLAQHFLRLTQGANLLNISIPFTLEKLTTLINDLLQQNNLENKDARIRLTLTRGQGQSSLAPSVDSTPTFIITAVPYQLPDAVNNIIVATIRRNECSPLANIKSLNYLDNILALQEAHKSNAEDALLFNTHDHLACATSANVFIVTQNKIYTPHLSDGALPGIMRRIVLQLAAQLSIPVQESTISLLQLQQATEIFLTNSLVGIRTVKHFNSQPLSATIANRLNSIFIRLRG